MKILQNNLFMSLLFVSYVVLFAVCGYKLNHSVYFPNQKLLTFEAFNIFLGINIVGILTWIVSSFIKNKQVIMASNLGIIILSALSFAFLFVMYFEASYILDRAHWPLTNLYEVSVFLYAITLGLAFVYAKKQQKIAFFVSIVLFAELALISWLESLGQNVYKELMPALKSYWLPIHVATNFIGYGAFCIAGMAGLMGMIKNYTKVRFLPTVEISEEISFKAIALGFPMFTIATVLGSLWAYEAWGAYWSWDPKETWALIVWLVYGIYLHLRVTNRVSKNMLCIISFIALILTAFCFLGVNIYLSGLHSYGQLT